MQAVKSAIALTLPRRPPAFRTVRSYRFQTVRAHNRALRFMSVRGSSGLHAQRAPYLGAFGAGTFFAVEPECRPGSGLTSAPAAAWVATGPPSSPAAVRRSRMV